MVGRRFHSLPGFRPEYGTGFIGFLIGIGIPAEDDVLRRFFDFAYPDIEMVAVALLAIAVTAPIQWLLARRAGRKFREASTKE